MPRSITGSCASENIISLFPTAGSTIDTCRLHVKLFLGKSWTPNCSLRCDLSVWMVVDHVSVASATSVWMGVTCVCQALWVVMKTTKEPFKSHNCTGWILISLSPLSWGLKLHIIKCLTDWRSSSQSNTSAPHTPFSYQIYTLPPQPHTLCVLSLALLLFCNKYSPLRTWKCEITDKNDKIQREQWKANAWN